MCGWTGILRAPTKKGPLGFLVVVWDSAAGESGASGSRKQDSVMLEDLSNMLGLSMSLWMTRMDHDAKKLAQSQVQLQRRFLVWDRPA